MLGVSVKSLFWFRESLSSCYSLSSPVFMKEFRKKFPVNFFSLNLDKLIWKLKILLNSSNSLLKTTLFLQWHTSIFLDPQKLFLPGDSPVPTFVLHLFTPSPCFCLSWRLLSLPQMFPFYEEIHIFNPSPPEEKHLRMMHSIADNILI
jgi:hypothetical protein